MNACTEPRGVLVTGASGGLGAALAREYAAPGRTLVLHGRNAVRLAAVASDCEARGALVVPFVFDLADVEGFRDALLRLAREHPIDLAIANAGVAIVNRGDGEDWAEVRDLLEVNVRAALATVDAVLPAMRARARGQVALVSSLGAWHGHSVAPSYNASKAALKVYGEAMRAWLAPQGIAVNVVLPGFVKTAMSDRFPARKPFLLTPEDAARRIRRGLAADRARIAFPQPLAFGAWLLGALPAAVSQRIARALGY